MSHFSVLVITETRPTDELLAEVLGPFDENGEWGREGTKWDWWQVGGRFSGMLVPGYDPREDPVNKRVCKLCNGTGKREKLATMVGTAAVGAMIPCNGCDATGVEVKWPTEWSDVGNRVQAKDLPLAQLQAEAATTAGEKWDRAEVVLQGRKWQSWQEILENMKLDGWAKAVEEARAIYWAQSAVAELKAAGFNAWGEDYKSLQKPRTEYVQAAVDGAIATFAVLKDGKWFERGKMGWWGAVTEEKDGATWHHEFRLLLEGLGPETWLTVVDCHV